LAQATLAAFGVSEFTQRTRRAQAAMAEEGLAALLLTSEPDVRYFSGFLTRFWESPTRPWFLIVPAAGRPLAVIPTIGAELMSTTWLSDIRTWDAPDYADDGVPLLAEAIREHAAKGDRVGVPIGRETSLRMPLADWANLWRELPNRHPADATPLLRDLQCRKSEAEVALIREACAIGGRAFDRVPKIAVPGAALADVFRQFQSLLLDEGADWVSYLAGASDRGGYSDVISPAHDAPLAAGDVLMLDTGAVRQGYFCDFDRNWSLGPAAKPVQEANRILYDCVERGFEAARPGARARDLHAAMSELLDLHSAGPIVGRLGHGLGMRLTEPPSLMPADDTRLLPGMVLTLEPALLIERGRMIVHEEVIVIGEDGPAWLTPRASREILVLDWGE
jgi:Xaa-Pro aminopeptidase